MQDAPLIAEDSIGGFIAARRQCLRQLDEIVVAVHARRAAASGELSGEAPRLQFIDADFLLGERESLYPDGAPPDSQVGVPRDVSRLSKMFPGVPVVASSAAARNPASTKPQQLAAPPTGMAAFLSEEEDDATEAVDVEALDREAAALDGGEQATTEPAGSDALDDRRTFDELRVGELGDAHLVASVTAVTCAAARHAGSELLRRNLVLPRSFADAQHALSIASATTDDGNNLRDPSQPTPFDDFFVSQGESPSQPKVRIGQGDAEQSRAEGSACAADFGAVGWLFHVDGRWEWVIVDDTVALAAAGGRRPLFMDVVPQPTGSAAVAQVPVGTEVAVPSTTVTGQRAPTELWPLLLEKAFAKLHCCYDGIDGGLPREALSTLTGAVEYRFDLHGQQDAEPCPQQRLPTHLPATLGGDDRPSSRHQHLKAHAKAGQRRAMPNAAIAAPMNEQAASYHEFVAAVFELDEAAPICVARARSRPTRAQELEGKRRADAEMRRREEELRNQPASEVRLIAAQHRARDLAVELIQHGALYPLVRCWRSEADGKGRVELYDAWSPDDKIAACNAAIGSARRERHAAALLAQAQRGRMSEAAVQKYARSPLTVRRGSAGRFITLLWDDFTALFEHVEGVRLPVDPLLPPSRLARCLARGDPIASTSHAVQGFALAPPTVAAANDTSDLLQDPTQPFVAKFEAPLRGTLDVFLAQRDPKTDVSRGERAAGHFIRKHTPYCMLALTVLRFPLDMDPCDLFRGALTSRTAVGIQTAIDRGLLRSPHAELVHASPAVYARQYSAQIDAEAGYYLVVPRILKGPATPFTVRVTTRATAVLGLRRLPLPLTADTSVVEAAAPPTVSQPQYLADTDVPVADKDGRVSLAQADAVSPPDADGVPHFVADALSRVQRDKAKLERFQQQQAQGAVDDSAVDSDDEPLSLRRARETRATGGRPREPPLTADGAGGVTTARLVRPSSIDAGATLAMSGSASPDGGANRRMLALLSEDSAKGQHGSIDLVVEHGLREAASDCDVLRAVGLDDTAASRERLTVASRQLRGTSGEPGGAAVIASSVAESFAEADVVGSGRLTNERHIDRAIGHLLLHHTRAGQALRRAALAQLDRTSACDGSGITPEHLALALVNAFGAPPEQ